LTPIDGRKLKQRIECHRMTKKKEKTLGEEIRENKYVKILRQCVLYSNSNF
jgi:hypothetical protein